MRDDGGWGCARGEDAAVPRTNSSSMCSEATTIAAGQPLGERDGMGGVWCAGVSRGSVELDDLIRELEDVDGTDADSGGGPDAAAHLRGGELPSASPLPPDRLHVELPLDLVDCVDYELQRVQEEGSQVPYRQLRQSLRLHRQQRLLERQHVHVTCGCFPAWWRKSAPVAPEPRQRTPAESLKAKSNAGTLSKEEQERAAQARREARREKTEKMLRDLNDPEPKLAPPALLGSSFRGVQSGGSFGRTSSSGTGNRGSFGRTPSSGSFSRTQSGGSRRTPSVGSFGRTASGGSGATPEEQSDTLAPLACFKDSLRISLSRSGRPAAADDQVTPLRAILDKAPSVAPDAASTPAQRRAELALRYSPSAGHSAVAETPRGRAGGDDSCSGRSGLSTLRRQCKPEQRTSAPQRLRPPVTPEEVWQTQVRLETQQYRGDPWSSSPQASPDASGRRMRDASGRGMPATAEDPAADASGRSGRDASQRGAHAGYAMSPHVSRGLSTSFGGTLPAQKLFL